MFYIRPSPFATRVNKSTGDLSALKYTDHETRDDQGYGILTLHTLIFAAGIEPLTLELLSHELLCTRTRSKIL